MSLEASVHRRSSWELKDERAQSYVGVRLDERWALLALIGQGASAAVYRATDQSTRQSVAIKILLAEQPAAKQRFVREAQIANQIKSPAVLPVLGSGETQDGRPFLVTELLNGQTLDDERLKAGGALPLPEVVALGVHVLGVLELAHAKQIVHRDLKPANLFRDASGMVYVLDFGLARALRERDTDSPISSLNMPLGTVGFMAPEQAQGRWDLIGPKADLYALAASLLKLATGLGVYDTDDPQQHFLWSTSRPAPSLLTRGVALPPEICRILDRGLCFAQHDRYASAREFRRALEQWEHGLHNPPRPQQHSARTFLWWPYLLGAVIGLLCAYAWLAVRH